MTHENNNNPNFDPHTHGTFSGEKRKSHRECGVTDCTNESTHTWSGHPTCDNHATPSRKKYVGLHTPEQLIAKDNAIDIATEAFVLLYAKGMFENNNELKADS